MFAGQTHCSANAYLTTVQSTLRVYDAVGALSGRIDQ